MDKKIKYLVEKLEDEPEEVAEGVIYVMPWIAVFKCPCGCKQTVYCSKISDSPKWTVVEHQDDTVTISPSVRRIAGCKSHFNIVKSEAKFCN